MTDYAREAARMEPDVQAAYIIVNNALVRDGLYAVGPFSHGVAKQAALMATDPEGPQRSIADALRVLASDLNRAAATIEPLTYTPAQERAIESMMNAIFDERCPGIRWDDNDRPPYRAASIAALDSLGILQLLRACPPPKWAEEASALASASEDEVPAAT